MTINKISPALFYQILAASRLQRRPVKHKEVISLNTPEIAAWNEQVEARKREKLRRKLGNHIPQE